MVDIKKRGRKTKEERLLARQEEIAERQVATNKYLKDEKYYKNNYWSWAAWDSWAAQGKAGSCPCGIGFYNGTLSNTRARTRRGGREDVCKNVSPHLCSDCIRLIEIKIKTEFKRH